VLTPYVSEINVSQKITDAFQRERLQHLFTADKEGGYIVRTAAESATIEAILADQVFLKILWSEIFLRAKQSKVGELIYEELPIELRIIRDLSTARIEKIRVDNEKSAQSIGAFSAKYIPSLRGKIEYYDSKLPIFDLYSIDDEIQKLLERKVYLQSGGYIIIDQTEALTTIDVNTGSFLGRTNTEQTIYQTNLEAVKIIASQIRLRNLGGIIIIDLIDMRHASHREGVLTSFKEEFLTDSARVEIHELTSLGLLQLTRKRTRESLGHILCDPCPTCKKKGFVKSLTTLCYDIYREIKRLETLYNWKAYLIRASQTIIAYLQHDEASGLAYLEAALDKRIHLQVDPLYGRERYSVLPGEKFFT
jgi:ribonuclease G